MFDWVERKPVKCPICGQEINEFQSKDGFKKLLRLTPEQLIKDAYEVLGETEVQYYGYCDNYCGVEEFLVKEDLYGV